MALTSLPVTKLRKSHNRHQNALYLLLSSIWIQVAAGRQWCTFYKKCDSQAPFTSFPCFGCLQQTASPLALPGIFSLFFFFALQPWLYIALILSKETVYAIAFFLKFGFSNGVWHQAYLYGPLSFGEGQGSFTIPLHLGFFLHLVHGSHNGSMLRCPPSLLLCIVYIQP